MKSVKLVTKDDKNIDEDTIQYFDPMVVNKENLRLVITGTARLKTGESVVIGVNGHDRR